MKIMLAGDVMLGRGIDQALPHACSPEIFEGYVRSAEGYVALAERRCGPISRPLAFDYPWGDALRALGLVSPAARIINLETAVTRRGRPEPRGINYRMAPENLPCLIAASVDCCILANNHVLDWGEEGLRDTLEALDLAGISRAGAGIDAEDSAAAALLPLDGDGSLRVYGVAHASSGVPLHWAAGTGHPGVALLPDLSEVSASRLAERIGAERQPGDLVVLSIHWGPNWGYSIGQESDFAHRLIDSGAVDLIHGHSSHHPKGLERYCRKLILYGCGDLLNDYEGIGGHEEFRPELALIYLPQLNEEGHCTALELLPFRISRFRLNSAVGTEAQWLADTLTRTSPAELGIDLAEAPCGLNGVTALSVAFRS